MNIAIPTPNRCVVSGLTFAALMFALPGLAVADIKLPAIISDHMVLKKGPASSIWGRADAGEKVTVTLGDHSAKTVAGTDGKWSATLDLSSAQSGPFDLTVEGKNKIVVRDVLVGEVWLASGQSNMAFLLEKQTGSAEEIANSENPALRQFQVTRAEPPQPADEGGGKWTVASPETSGKFSAVGYFFQKQLNKELGVPVGIISANLHPARQALRIFRNATNRCASWPEKSGRISTGKRSLRAATARDLCSAAQTPHQP